MSRDSAAKVPPSCLDGLICAPAVTKSNTDAVFDVACRKCGGVSFRIEAHPVVAPDPSPYFGIAPGQVLYRPPHALVCTSCRTSTPVFDARKQGYDGVLNGGCAYESGDGQGSVVEGEFRFVISFGYSIEPSELEELAAESKVQPSDLFDSISIVGISIRTDSKFEIAYECA